MSVNIFNAAYYAAVNSDLAAAGLTTQAQLSAHFLNNGLNEGRSFSPLINLDLYRQLNPDLAAAGLTTRQQIFSHLQIMGLPKDAHFHQR